MDSERWHKIEALYNSARSLDSNDRAGWLAQACANEEEIRQEVLSLLESADTEDSFLEEPALSYGLQVIRLESESLIGSTVGHYKILEILGRGGMGEVYLAYDPRLNRRVALKLLPATITEDRERVRRFEHEARAASAISHPNVAHIYEIGEAEGRHYITMEYIKGLTLRHLLRKKMLDPDRALEIAIEVAVALSAAHRAGVIHRDIKPENILMADDGYVKVLDFGLAKLIETPSFKSDLNSQFTTSFHTEPGLFMGTSHYMSPEQIRRQSVDLRTDLWSLGVVTYEMLTFRRPFQGQSFSEVIAAIIEKEPDLGSTEHANLNPSLQGLLRRALKKRPEDRYQNADELLRDLRELKRNGAQTLHLRADVEAGQTGEAEVVRKTVETGRETMTTAADPIRPQTLSERFDTVVEESFTRRSVFSLLSKRLQLTLAAILVIIAGSYFALVRKGPGTLAGAAINPRFERLNLSGNIRDMVLSPDGKYVAYIVMEAGRHTIHIMELATTSDLRVGVPSEEGYSALSFTPDGNYVYYLEDHAETGTLYRVSKLGGGLRKILNNVNTSVAFSPDGEQMAFVRTDESPEPGQLIVARNDGSSERVLAKRTMADTDFFLTDTKGPGPVWSPDGKLLACPTHNRSHGRPEINIDLVAVESGIGRRLNTTPWENIARVAWLADGSGLVIAGSDKPGSRGQLHLIDSSDGRSRKITNDPNNYSLLSAGRDSSLFLALNIEDNASLWQISIATGAEPTTLAVSERKGVLHVNWDRHGKMLYTISDGVHSNIWSEEAGEPEARQLTFEADNARAVSTPDGLYIVFVSTRAGSTNIWRINVDGTNPLQLTTGKYEDVPSVTPDGQWVIYRTGNEIRKVSINGGTSIKLLDRMTIRPALSADGHSLALFASDQSDTKQWHIEVYNLETVSPLKTFEVPKGTDAFNDLRWTPDGQALAYVSKANGAANIWVQPLSGAAPHQLTTFNDSGILSFVWSASGKELRCVRNTKAYIPVLVRLF